MRKIAAGGSLPAPGRAGAPRVICLSAREQEIVTLLEAGLTNKEVAAKLYLSPETVKTYVARIFKKLGVRNRTEAVFKAKVLLDTPAPEARPRSLSVVKVRG
ncbi:MAG: response regulator transcription factor [Thermoleophilia bacterium]